MASDVEKINEVAEKLAETAWDSYRTIVDHAVGLQERIVGFAQGVVDGSIKEWRYQTEGNRAMTGEFVERVERSLDAYMDLAYAHLSHYKQGPQAVK